MMMSKWPDGFDVWVYHGANRWSASILDNRPGVTSIGFHGYTTRQEAELAALDWIQRRIGKPETVPQPVLAKHDDYSLITSESHVEDLLWRLNELENDLPTPKQADFPDEREHIAAADCWQYRCGLIEALRNSLQAELEMIREKL